MDPRYLSLFLSGLVGGFGAFFLGFPMPFLLGGIIGTASFVLIYERNGRELPKLSRWVRFIFASLIGAMIGTRFSPELLPLLPQFWPSLPAIIVFIVLAHAGNYAVMRGLGRYEKKDAYFAALPGGIVDSALLAEQAGADVRVVTAQHFIRIILVVATIPFLFWFIQGDFVGSLAGETLATAEYGPMDIAKIVAIAMVGLFIGRALHLPVSHMVGPLILGLVLSVTGVINVNIPGWLLSMAQFMMGVALGSQFSGVSRRLLLRGLGTGILSGAFMLSLAAVIAGVMVRYVPADFSALFISFAAGGLAEMSLIALTLNFNPVVVALHHLVRIFFTIWIGIAAAKYVIGPTKEP